MSKVKCHHCNGRKKRGGMGFILIDCPNCKATGFIDIPDAEPVTTPVNEKPSRKRKKVTVLGVSAEDLQKTSEGTQANVIVGEQSNDDKQRFGKGNQAIGVSNE